MSHDIRTPMNAIVGLVSIAQAHVDDPDRTKEYLNRITVSSKHLLSLINDILDMSKIESGKFRLNCTPFMLPEVTEKFLDIVAPQMRAKHLRFDVCIFDITHEALVGDTLRLSQVLFNLTSNAVKYTRRRRGAGEHNRDAQREARLRAVGLRDRGHGHRHEP